MVDKKFEPRQTGIADPAAQPVVDLLTSILNDVQSRVQVSTATAPIVLAGEAARAVALFKEIESAIALAAAPTVTLTAEPATSTSSGMQHTLTWTTTGADTISIVGVDANGVSTTVPDVTPLATGSVNVKVLTTTVFTATATKTGRCSATAVATVRVGGGVIFKPEA
jgi:hypothetical protein